MKRINYVPIFKVHILKIWFSVQMTCRTLSGSYLRKIITTKMKHSFGKKCKAKCVFTYFLPSECLLKYDRPLSQFNFCLVVLLSAFKEDKYQWIREERWVIFMTIITAGILQMFQLFSGILDPNDKSKHLFLPVIGLNHPWNIFLKQVYRYPVRSLNYSFLFQYILILRC